MEEVHPIYELLGRFIPFFASSVWVSLLAVSLRDCKTRREQLLKRLSMVFFIIFSLSCLLPVLDAYFITTSTLLGVLTHVVPIYLPVIGYSLVWYMTDTAKEDSFHYLRHATLPLIYLLLLIVSKLMFKIFASTPLDYLYTIVASLFALCYLLLSFIRIRKYRNTLDADWKETTDVKIWYRFVRWVAVVTTLSLGIIMLPQNSTVLFVIYLALMFWFVFISSYLCYCSVFLNYAQFTSRRIILAKEPATPVMEQPKKQYRRIAKLSKNANGKMEMEPLTRRRFEAYIKKHKPYLDVNFKMTDLESALNANRTVISKFINRTYRMNFNRYINSLRIKEVERLKQLTTSNKSTMTELVRKAGFNSMQSYNRAIFIENDGAQNEEQELL